MSNKLPDLEHQTRMTIALETIANHTIAKEGSIEALILAMIDGTAAGFQKAMKVFMQLNGITVTSTPAEITAQVTGFYQLLQDNFNWDGGVTFYCPDVSSQSDGVRFGDNTKLTCVPSTATTKGQDDYEGLPLFAVVDCNWQMDDTNKCPQITAIEGIAGQFERYNTAKYVGVLQMTGYHYYTNPGDEGTQTFTEGYRIGYDPSKKNCAPLPEAVAMDGTVRPWVVHAKYNAGLTDNKMTCCSGVATQGNFSHNNAITYSRNISTSYSGTCSVDIGFLQIMARIKFASLTIDTVLNFDNSYNVTDTALVSETGVKRVVVDATKKSSYIVGSRVVIGTSSSHDQLRQDNVSKIGYKVVSVEDVTIGDTKYAAVYVESDSTFDTVAGDSDATKNTIISSAKWPTGTTDSIPGNTGSIDPTAGKYPCKLQGIEFGVGCWEVLADTIISLTMETIDGVDTYYEEAFTVKDTSKQATSLTDDYKSCGIKILQNGEGWTKELKWGNNGLLYPTQIGGSSSTYCRDYHYHNNQGQKQTGTREWLTFGTLYNFGWAGLFALDGRNGLIARWWCYASRLSPNGCRG